MHFFGCCESIILLLRISQLFIYCKSTNYFTTGNRLNICLLCIEKFYDKFTLLIWKYFDDLYGFCVKHNFLTTAHHTIILLLRIPQLFNYCKSTNYFTTGNRLNFWLLCIGLLYDNFKSTIWKRFNDLYGYCTKLIFSLLRIYYFATAHLQTIYLVQIDQLFLHWESSKYFVTFNRKILWQFHIAYLEKVDDLYGFCPKLNF